MQKLGQGKKKPPHCHPEWMITSPFSASKATKNMNNKTYIWCTKCHGARGLWVCTHNTEMHQDGFYRNRQNGKEKPTMTDNKGKTPLPTPPSYTLPPALAAQLSLSNYMENYFNKLLDSPFGGTVSNPS